MLQWFVKKQLLERLAKRELSYLTRQKAQQNPNHVTGREVKR